jgi:hypothetical protein
MYTACFISLLVLNSAKLKKMVGNANL